MGGREGGWRGGGQTGASAEVADAGRRRSTRTRWATESRLPSYFPPHPSAPQPGLSPWPESPLQHAIALHPSTVAAKPPCVHLPRTQPPWRKPFSSNTVCNRRSRHIPTTCPPSTTRVALRHMLTLNPLHWAPVWRQTGESDGKAQQLLGQDEVTHSRLSLSQGHGRQVIYRRQPRTMKGLDKNEGQPRDEDIDTGRGVSRSSQSGSSLQKPAPPSCSQASQARPSHRPSTTAIALTPTPSIPSRATDGPRAAKHLGQAVPGPPPCCGVRGH